MNSFTQVSKTQKAIYLIATLLALITTVVTVLLIMAHYETSATGSFCNINDYWNCDRVNKSSFAVIFGIPVAILGFLYYVFLTLVYLGLWRSFDFLRLLKPLKSIFVLKSTFIIVVLSTIVLTALEFYYLGNMAYVAYLKVILLLLLNVWIFKYARKQASQYSDILGTVAILALFGVSFSLYLTDIELFVLQAICVYCFTQQILIILIFALTLIALKINTNGSTTTKSIK